MKRKKKEIEEMVKIKCKNSWGGSHFNNKNSISKVNCLIWLMKKDDRGSKTKYKKLICIAENVARSLELKIS